MTLVLLKMDVMLWALHCKSNTDYVDAVISCDMHVIIG